MPVSLAAQVTIILGEERERVFHSFTLKLDVLQFSVLDSSTVAIS